MVPYTLAGTEFSWRKVHSFQQTLKEFHDPDKVPNQCKGGHQLPKSSS